VGRRARRIALAVAAAAVVAVGAGYAVLALTGDDPPPPPRLSEGADAGSASGRWRPLATGGTFVGYRVNEAYLGVGVRTAVGRTSAVAGSVAVTGNRVRSASLRADLRSLRSDEARRDDALRYRGIETDRYPTARFTLARTVALSVGARRATGTLELHGRRTTVAVAVRGQRLAGDRLELVGSAPIRFADFAIRPPSVAGIVTVRDHGRLEFRLVLAPAR
jgi:polyisoprenoid-binding protein YceI